MMRRFFADGLHWMAVVGFLLGYALYNASDARADGYLSDTETAYITAYGAGAICPTIIEFPSTAGVMGVMEGIHQDGFSYGDSVDVINAAVLAYCPAEWPLLQAIGRAARAEHGGTLT